MALTQIFRQDVSNLADLARAIDAVEELGINLAEISTMNASSNALLSEGEPTVGFQVSSFVNREGKTGYIAELS